MILWTQDVWHYSALRAGLAIAPGPVMVPIFVALHHRFAGRVRPGRVAAAGNAIFALGTVVLFTRLGQEPHYFTTLLPGWLLMGIGVGLTLPTILSSATADLPRERAATGSAVVNMTRQVGTVLGVSVFVAVVGSHATYEATHHAFQAAWLITAGAALVAGGELVRHDARGRRPGHREASAAHAASLRGPALTRTSRRVAAPRQGAGPRVRAPAGAVHRSSPSEPVGKPPVSARSEGPSPGTGSGKQGGTAGAGMRPRPCTGAE